MYRCVLCPCVTGVGVIRMLVQPPPGCPSVRNLVVVMAMRPVTPTSPMFAPYTELRDLVGRRRLTQV